MRRAAELDAFRPSRFVRFAAAPSHGRSLSRRWRRRCNLPCFHDNDLVLRFDGVRPARSTFESSATATRFQRGFHVSCNRFQRGLPVRCRRLQRVSNVRAHPPCADAARCHEDCGEWGGWMLDVARRCGRLLRAICWEDFQPAAVGILDEVDAHALVHEAHAAHLLV